MHQKVGLRTGRTPPFMKTSFSKHIDHLMKLDEVKADAELAGRIRSIVKYFDHDDVRAYLLGQVLHGKISTAYSEELAMKRFLKFMEANNLDDYFFGRKKIVFKGDQI